MRAKSIPHVEYEIFKHILDNIDIAEVKETMVIAPRLREVEDRFNKGYVSAAKLIDNLCERRRHKLPENHVDYKEKEE
jgi:hypothetical protein|tara:strand:+ start:328 stop:561 length:234 start_codon:yes stop_codon:yes gene_type:complete